MSMSDNTFEKAPSMIGKEQRERVQQYTASAMSRESSLYADPESHVSPCVFHHKVYGAMTGFLSCDGYFIAATLQPSIDGAERFRVHGRKAFLLSTGDVRTFCQELLHGRLIRAVNDAFTGMHVLATAS